MHVARLDVDIDELGGGGAAAVEGDLKGDAGRPLGAGRDQPQPVRLHVVRLRATSKPHSEQRPRRKSCASTASDTQFRRPVCECVHSTHGCCLFLCVRHSVKAPCL